MALEAPLRSSTGSIIAFSPQTDIAVSSPDSPAVLNSKSAGASISSSDSLPIRPHSRLRALPAQVMSPTSDIVGPSPVTSNGTETTEIEDDDPADGTEDHETQMPQQLKMLRTNLPSHIRHNSNEEAVSVIHAPESFQSWVTNGGSVGGTPAPSQLTREVDLGSPSASDTTDSFSTAYQVTAPPPISTDVKPVRFSIDDATPQAQSLDDLLSESRVRAASVGGLENIPEIRETEGDHEAGGLITSPHMVEADENDALQTALEECWTLCNTLANLSSIHRERMFNSSGTPDANEKAWKCCWKLCQKLYHSRDEARENFGVRMNLDLCRDFCQSLFDVRQRKDEVDDSILRVSFELNNHLYSAQDSRILPEPFQERTLDFYITLCHRLMKQRSEMAEETDSLLRACWSLAEMLFSLRQNSRDNRAPDEELLGSAVQACWELCDIFREGWTQIRPDRGTPRPSQISFQFPLQNSDTASVQSGSRVSMTQRDSFTGSIQERPGSVVSSMSSRKTRPQPPPPPPTVPETPVTEFEDTPISPESSSPQMPNIMVLGTNGDGSRSSVGGGPRWPSSASNLSGYSQGSNKTSSTATTATSAEDINITRIKMLILKAAMNMGFNRDQAAGDGSGGTKTLQAFVKNLPAGSFGSLPLHTALLQNYKKLVQADQSFRSSNSLPTRGRRVAATDAAKSVGWMMLRSNQYTFLRDLFRLVFSFPIEEADTRKNVYITV